MNDFEFTAPADGQEALRFLAEYGEDAQLIAGGTGLVNMMKQNLVYPEMLISLHRVAELNDLMVHGDEVEIGATYSLLALENDDRAASLPLLGQTLRSLASPRIRGMATMGGAVAHGDPAQDLPVTLMALGAIVVLDSLKEHRELPLEDFLVDHYETAIQTGELLTSVRIPVPDPSRRYWFHKFSPKTVEDYATVTVAISVGVADGVITDARIALGGVGPRVFLATDAMAPLAGCRLDELDAMAAGQAAAAMTDPMADTRGSEAYKREMSTVWVKRGLEALRDGV